MRKRVHNLMLKRAKTKEEKTISERNVILFKASKEFKKFINQNE